MTVRAATAASYPLTWLYAPGDRPRVVAKALLSGADVVIVDLEDAVAPNRKDYARAATADLLTDPEHPVPVHVRVNALDTPPGAKDIAILAALPGLAALR
uniref:aldolase/citrate lyase family protein n=1 Tax=Clavibacter michiganensis TaxID=28447 RepID=UPI002930BC82